jgi:hypothetical protein
MKFEVTVRYDDGTEEKVTAGQRDCAAWEAEPFGCSSVGAMDQKPMMFLRYLAWSALRRSRPGVPPYAKWQAGVDEVEPPDDDEQGVTPDPTNPDQPDEV